MKTAKKSTNVRKAVKAALRELLHEREEFFVDAMTEALEDIGMIRAIEEGLKSGPASREEVFIALRRTG